MRIRTQLRAVIGICLAVVATAAALVGAAVTRESAAEQAQERAQVIENEVAGLLTLTEEYARYAEPRAASQWRKRHAAIQAALAAEELPQLAGQPLVELRTVTTDLPGLFARLEALPDSADAFTQRRKAAIVDQLLTSTQAMSDYAYQWYQDSASAHRSVERDVRVMTGGVLVAMMATLVGMAILIGHQVLRPMTQLDQAAAMVRRGDLTRRLGASALNEFGDLARQFDAMSAALEDSSGRLARSETQLRAVTDNMPALVVYINRDHRYEFANRKFLDMVRAEPGELVGRTVRDVLGPAMYDRVRPNLDRALAGERFQWDSPMEVGGQTRHMLIEYIPDRADDGAIRGCYALTLDITDRREAELRIAKSEQRLLDLMNGMPAMVGYFDMQERCLYANEAGLRSQGLERSDLPGLTLRAALGESNYAQHEPYVREALKGQRARLEGKIPFKGRPAYFQAHLIPDRVEGGAQRGFYLMTFDVTALKEAQLRQASAEQRLRSIADNLPVLIAYVDREERYRFLNETFRDWLGIDPATAVGRPVRETIGEELHGQRGDFFARALAGERVSFEVESAMQDCVRTLQNVYIPDIQSDGTVLGFYALSTDVTPLKAVEQRLRRLVRLDTLTGLANRYEFNEALPLALARAQRAGTGVALMFLDIDKFKTINDSFGHATGDAVLKEVATRLVESVRVTDAVARLAGDEFVITLEGLQSDADAQAIAHKILARFARPVQTGGTELAVTTSIGIAYAAPRQAPVSSSGLLAIADEALYAAKAAGRNTSCLRACGTQPERLPA